jgi:hypothetical protein
VLGAEKSVIGSEEVRQAFHWLASRFSDCTDYRFELVAAGVSGTWPTPSATSTSPSPWTAARSSQRPCASPTSTGVRTASGRPSTAMPTRPRPVRSVPPTHRRSKRSSSGPGPRWSRSRAVNGRNATDITASDGHQLPTSAVLLHPARPARATGGFALAQKRPVDHGAVVRWSDTSPEPRGVAELVATGSVEAMRWRWPVSA